MMMSDLGLGEWKPLVSGTNIPAGDDRWTSPSFVVGIATGDGDDGADDVEAVSGPL